MELLPAFLALWLLLPQSRCAGKTVTIGNGSGELDYPTAQQTLNLQPGDTVYINPGAYAGITLSAISGTAARPIIVKADPKTVFRTTVPHANAVHDLAYVVFDGLRYQDYNGNAMKVEGASHDLTFKNMALIHGGGFNIYDKAKVFDGARASAFSNIKWQNCTFDAAGIISEDWSPLSNLISVALDFEVSHCTFAHYDCSKGPATIIDIGKAFNLQVHDCSFSDLGICASPIGHDACIVYRGFAKIYNNRFTREWGDDVRSFPIKLNALGYNGPDAVTRFYNNIAYEKRKYAMFEQNGMVPQAELDNSRGFFSRTSAEVYFNTLYRSRKVDYCAPLVDIYAPNIVIRYNLIIEPECDVAWNPQYDLAPDAPVSLRNNYVYHVGTELGPQPGVVVDHNLVCRTLPESGLADAQSFRPDAASPARNRAGIVPYIQDDFYHKPRYRRGVADIGAVEGQ